MHLIKTSSRQVLAATLVIWIMVRSLKCWNKPNPPSLFMIRSI